MKSNDQQQHCSGLSSQSVSRGDHLSKTCIDKLVLRDMWGYKQLDEKQTKKANIAVQIIQSVAANYHLQGCSEGWKSISQRPYLRSLMYSQRTSNYKSDSVRGCAGISPSELTLDRGSTSCGWGLGSTTKKALSVWRKKTLLLSPAYTEMLLEFKVCVIISFKILP